MAITPLQMLQNISANATAQQGKLNTMTAQPAQTGFRNPGQTGIEAFMNPDQSQAAAMKDIAMRMMGSDPSKGPAAGFADSVSKGLSLMDTIKETRRSGQIAAQEGVVGGAKDEFGRAKDIVGMIPKPVAPPTAKTMIELVRNEDIGNPQAPSVKAIQVGSRFYTPDGKELSAEDMEGYSKKPGTNLSGTPSDFTPKTVRAANLTAIIKMRKRLAGAKGLEEKDFKANFGTLGRIKGKIGKALDSMTGLGGDSLNTLIEGLSGTDLVEFNANQRVVFEQTEQVFLDYKFEVTGAAAALAEIQALRIAVFNKELAPAEAEASYRALMGRWDLQMKEMELAEAQGRPATDYFPTDEGSGGLAGQSAKGGAPMVVQRTVSREGEPDRVQGANGKWYRKIPKNPVGTE